MMKIYGEYFCGNKISPYGIKNGYVDYGTFSRAFQHILANDLMGRTGGEWELISGDYEREVFQWYIVDRTGADLCSRAGEIVYYNWELDLHLWGVTHYGTAWDCVLTDIPCNTQD